MKRAVIAVSFALVGAVAARAFAADPTAPVKVKEVALEGGPNVDGMGFDGATGRLFVSHGAAVDVIDVKTYELAGKIEGLERARSIAMVPELRRGFVASSKKNRLIAFDLDSLQILKEIPTGDFPSGVAYVGTTKEVWTFNAGSNSATCVDASSYEVKATIAFEGAPQAAVEHAAKRLVYVIVQSPDGVAVVDAKSRKISATQPVAPGAEPKGIAIDPKSGLVLVGCGNQKLVILDSSCWKVAAQYDTGSKTGPTVVDTVGGIGFAISEERARVVHLKSAKSVGLLPGIDTDGARAATIDPKSRTLYVACGFGKGEEGTAKLLVFAPK